VVLEGENLMEMIVGHGVPTLGCTRVVHVCRLARSAHAYFRIIGHTVRLSLAARINRRPPQKRYFTRILGSAWVEMLAFREDESAKHQKS
jgi:hypothetical protein